MTSNGENCLIWSITRIVNDINPFPFQGLGSRDSFGKVPDPPIVVPHRKKNRQPHPTKEPTQQIHCFRGPAVCAVKEIPGDDQLNSSNLHKYSLKPLQILGGIALGDRNATHLKCHCLSQMNIRYYQRLGLVKKDNCSRTLHEEKPLCKSLKISNKRRGKC